MDVFVDKHLSLLSQERDEELSEGVHLLTTGLKNLKEKEEKGHCVTRLQVESQRIGLYGRCVISFELSKKLGRKNIPVNSISSGDIVGIFAGGKSLVADKLLSGIVTKSSELIISVAFEEIPENIDITGHNGALQLVKLANDVTYRRLKRALEDLHTFQNGRCSHLIDVLFNASPPSPSHPKWDNLIGQLVHEIPPKSWEPEQEYSPAPEVKNVFHNFSFLNHSLDKSQQKAVLFALSRPDVAIIHGPPGTGKTTTVVEFIIQCTKLKQKVLVCAPSNIAVDNLVERLARSGAKLIRLGHPARLVSSVLQHSLDNLLANSDGAEIVKDIRKEMNTAMSKSGSAKISADRRKWRNEMKTLKKELLQREEKLLRELLKKADVILATNTGASLDGPLKHLPKDHFDVTVIDECAQALEASCWIPLTHAPKCVLAGDHKQLPPTILSNEAAKNGLSVTLMERLVELYGDQITALLTTQYRMHHDIMEWPSQYLYDGVLTAHQSVCGHLLKDLNGVSTTPMTSCPLFFIDTAGCDLHEMETGSDESKGNDGEADIVLKLVKDLLDGGVPPQDIAVIAPYNLQVDILKQRINAVGLLSSKIEVRSVDGFQGREKEAVIISFTRSNRKGEIGFLKEQRRTNVAVTRARRHLTIIGDSDTISHDPFIKGLIEYCSDHGEIHSAHEYIHSDIWESSSHTDIQSSISEKEINEKINGEMKKGGDSNDHITSDKLPSLNDTKKEVFTTVTIVDKEACKVTMSKNDDTCTSDDFREKLEQFIADEEQVDITFPSTLTSSQRRLIHELAEQFKLNHESCGEGKERYVVVKKKVQNETSTLTQSEYITLKDEEFKEVSQKIPDKQNEQNESAVPKTIDSIISDVVLEETPLATRGLWKCTVCHLVIPEINKELHQLRCERENRKHEEVMKQKVKSGKVNRAENEAQKSLKGVKKTPGAGNNKKQVSKTGLTSRTDVDTELDELIAQMRLADSTCGYPDCKKSVSLLGMRCTFCNRKYCTSHNIAEVHGCGTAAKKHARDKMEREAKEQMGEGRGRRSMDASKRAQLQRRLDSKIDEMTSDRHKKKQSSKK